MTALVGLMGQKRSGKDTAASILVAECGYTRFAFADPMKEALLQVDPFARNGSRVSHLIEHLGWEGAKTFPEVRRLLQEFGIAIRAIQPDFWVQATMKPAEKQLDTGSVVITDVRFPNEADAIRILGGTLIRVERPGLPDTDPHPSEHAWRDIKPDIVVANDSTVEALHTRIRDIALEL